MISNSKIILIRNFILEEMDNPSSRVRVEATDIEVESTKKRSSSNFRFKVFSQKGKNALMRITYSAYGIDGEYTTDTKVETLPAEEVNELFYSVAAH